MILDNTDFDFCVSVLLPQKLQKLITYSVLKNISFMK